MSDGCLPWKNPTSTLSSLVTEKSSALPKLSLVISLQSSFQSPLIGTETAIGLSMAEKERKLPLALQGLGAATAVLVEVELGWRKVIVCAPTPRVVPCVNSARYCVVDDAT